MKNQELINYLIKNYSIKYTQQRIIDMLTAGYIDYEDCEDWAIGWNFLFKEVPEIVLKHFEIKEKKEDVQFRENTESELRGDDLPF